MKKSKRRIGALLVIAVLTVSIIGSNIGVFARQYPAMNPNGYDQSWYVEKEKLLTFDTNLTTLTNKAKKIVFGNSKYQPNNTYWWVVGNEGGDLLLYGTELFIQEAYNSTTGTKAYNADWGCTYDTGDPTNVDSAHWGASDFRAKLKNTYLDQYFTPGEQSLMKDSTLQNRDKLNGKGYTTSDKLYLPYWEGDATKPDQVNHIYGGENNDKRIDNEFWIFQGRWGCTRTEYNGVEPDVVNYYDNYLANVPHDDSSRVGTPFAQTILTKLDISNLAFASIIRSGAHWDSLGWLTNKPYSYMTNQEALTLRFNSQESLGTATVNTITGEINVQNPAAETYLMVEDPTGGYVYRLTEGEDTTINANDIVLTKGGPGVSDISKCKVWLEKTIDKVSYITWANFVEGWNVSVLKGDGMTKTDESGETVQNVEKTTAMTDITFTAKEGYYFPEDYAVAETNGITMTRVDENTVTVSGTPTADTSVTLPAATAKEKATTPTLEASTAQGAVTANTITVAELPDSATYGTALYSIGDGAWQESPVFTGLKADTQYQIHAKYAGNALYGASDAATATISTMEAAYEINTPDTLNAGIDTGYININENKAFDLGNNGKVSVKVTGGLDANGKVTLTHTNGTDTVTSQMEVNGNDFSDTFQALASFTQMDGRVITLSFNAPGETNIAPGTYTGTVNLTTVYSDSAVQSASTVDKDNADFSVQVVFNKEEEPIPTPSPTAEPTAVPTAIPTAEPTAVPTAEPTVVPTQVPTSEPTNEPTRVPTQAPTVLPTQTPTVMPTIQPTIPETPTAAPGQGNNTNNATVSPGNKAADTGDSAPIGEMGVALIAALGMLVAVRKKIKK